MRRTGWKRFVILAVVACASSQACGESESNPDSAASSAGGTGGSDSTSASGTTGGTTGGGQQNATCGDVLCEGLNLEVIGGPQVAGCCTEDPAADACGIETGFLAEYGVELSRACQPRNSPGEEDENCPASPPISVSSLSISFPGCCLPSKKCGFFLESLLGGLIPLGMGCIDAAELPDSDLSEPPSCDPTGSSPGGAAGAAGAGGAR